jgi:micrococcal nuclease
MKKFLLLTIIIFLIIGCEAQIEIDSRPTGQTLAAESNLPSPPQIDLSQYTGDMPDYYGRVVDVADGDTFYIDWYTEDKMGVRIKGIDTPETVDSRKDVQYWGPEASEYTKSILSPGTIIRLDFNGEITGPFGRLLAYVYYWDGDEWVYWNEKVLKDGMAFVYANYEFVYVEEFLEYQSHAIENGSGMWSNPGNIENEVVRNIEEFFNHPDAGWFRADMRRENPDLYEKLKGN